MKHGTKKWAKEVEKYCPELVVKEFLNSGSYSAFFPLPPDKKGEDDLLITIPWQVVDLLVAARREVEEQKEFIEALESDCEWIPKWCL